MLEESTLRRLYLEEQRSIRAIAAFVQVSPRTVYDDLIRYRIPRRPAGFRGARAQSAATPFDEATLRQSYEVEGRSIRAIAELTQTSTRTVYDALIRYRIPRRTTGRQRLTHPTSPIADGFLDEAVLRHLYLEEGRSISAIALAAQCSPSRIRNALVRYGIARRRRGRRSSAMRDRV